MQSNCLPTAKEWQSDHLEELRPIADNGPGEIKRSYSALEDCAVTRVQCTLVSIM